MYVKSPDEKARLLELMSQVYDHSMWSLGPMTKRAEECCSELIFGSEKEALLVNDGTHALELCLRDINVAGKVVFYPVMTVPMVPWAIKRAGGIPHALDVNNMFCLSANALKDATNGLTGVPTDNIGACITVHTGGIIANDIFRIVQICEQAGIPLIEDISHAQCSTIQNQGEYLLAGTFGDYAAFSMYATKVISVGEGGFAAKRGNIEGMRSTRNQGKNANAEYVKQGYNYRANEWTAAVALTKMEFLYRELEHRRKMAKKYEDAGIEGLHSRSIFKLMPSFYKFIYEIPWSFEPRIPNTTGAVHRELLPSPFGAYPTAESASTNHVCLALKDEVSVNACIESILKIKAG
jgi:dTDP-4-amino-4,6-dideoxygalactose transaminase